MIRKIIFILTVYMALVCLVLGCSDNPVTPQVSDETSAAMGENRESGSSHSCLGYYELVIDTTAGTIDILPLRSADWRFNVVGVLNGTMGVSAVGVPSEADPPNGLFVFDITLKHPFATKPQFSGFDVKGILMTPGSLPVGTLMFARVNETRLENADGYTRWWNPTEFTTPGWFGYTKGNLTNTPGTDLTATVNPYKLFADILGPTDDLDVLNGVEYDGDLSRAVFLAGSSNTRRYYIRFPMNPGPVVKYGYAVDVSWSAPLPNPPTQIPDDFSYGANQGEAYRLKCTPVVNSLYYDAETGHAGGYLLLNGRVRDWRGEFLDNVAGEVELVRSYAPGLISGGMDWYFMYEDEHNAYYGFEPEDLAVPSKAGDVLIMTRAQSINNYYDQAAAPAPAGKVSAWDVVKVNVEDPDCVADSNNIMAEAEPIEAIDDVTGNLCFGDDFEDFYAFEVPPGYKVSGMIFYHHYTGDQNINNLILLDEGGQNLSCSVANPDYNSIYIDSTNTYMLPGKYYIRVSANIDYGAFKYALQTRLALTSVTPLNPVDVTPMDMDCFATWVDASLIGSSRVMAAGPAGTFSLESHWLGTDGKIRDPMTFEPAYWNPYMYYVEDKIENPAGIDFDDYTNMQVPVHHEDVLSIVGSVRSIALDSNYLYIAVHETTHFYVHIYDYLTDPTNPVFVDKFQVYPDIIKIDILKPGTSESVLATINPHNTCIYDISDPHNVSFLDFVVQPDNLENLTMDIDREEDFIIRTYFDENDYSGHFQALRLNSSNGLTSYGIVDLPGLGSAVTASMFRVFVDNGIGGFTAYYIMGQGNIVERDSCNTIGALQYMDVRSTKLCTAEAGAGPQIYSVADLDAIGISVRSMYINCPQDGFSQDSRSYFIDSSTGYSALKCLKTPGPDSFALTYDYKLDGFARSIANCGDMVIVGAWGDKKVWVIDISSIDTPPTLAYSATYPAYVTSVAITQDAAYIALDNGTMKILNVTAFPTVTAEADESFPGELWNMQISGHYLFATYNDDIRLFNVYDPYTLFYVGDHDYGGDSELQDLVVTNGGYIYAITADSLEIIKFQGTTTFIDLGSLPVYNPLTDLAVDWSVAYLLSPNVPPVAAYVFPPDAPSILGSSFGDFTGWTSYGISVYKDRLYCMHNVTGLQIFDLY